MPANVVTLLPDRKGAHGAWLYRCGALVVLGLWVTALFLPHATTTRDEFGGTGRDYGYHLAVWGWLGPTTL
jgi:hypothetical protein